MTAAFHAAAYRFHRRPLWNNGSPAGACHRLAEGETRWRDDARVYARARTNDGRHTPRKRSIQYAAAYRFHRWRLWNTGSRFRGDDGLVFVDTLPGGTSAEAGRASTLAVPMCTLAEPTSPEAATSGVTAAALLEIGVEGIGVMDPMAPATRTAGLIRTATGRNELKPMGVLLNVHLASHESSRLVTSVPSR